MWILKYRGSTQLHDKKPNRKGEVRVRPEPVE
jgi:hypothetical protein